jgi:general stress protein YciG
MAEKENKKPRRRGGRGFASMDPERQREIASRGGRASQQQRAKEERRQGRGVDEERLTEPGREIRSEEEGYEGR